MIVPFIIDAQSIKGKVVSEKNEALPYVNVYHSKSAKGTITNENGEFYLYLDGFSKQDTIVFSYVGKKTEKRTIKEILKDSLIVMKDQLVNLTAVEVFSKEITAYDFVLKAFENIPKNYCTTAHNSYAYYREFQKQVHVGKDSAERSLQAALFIEQSPYKSKSYAWLKDRSYILAINKSEDSLQKFAINTNYLTFTLTSNILKYHNKYGFDSKKKIQEKWNMKKEFYCLQDSEYIYKISFSPVDTTKWGERGYFLISSGDYKIYRYEVNVTKGVYNENNWDKYGYINYLPYRVVNIFIKSSNGMKLGYLKYYNCIETRDKNIKLTSFLLYDCELKIIDGMEEALKDFPKTEVEKNKDLYYQKENSDPDFWKHFNVEDIHIDGN